MSNNFADSIISLGHNCYPAIYSQKKTGDELQVFCDMAIPAWALLPIVRDNFIALHDKNDYVYMRIFENSGINYLTNKTYYTRMAKGTAIGTRFLERLNDKKEKFYDKLRSTDYVLFMRYEESQKSDLPHIIGKRIIYSQYAAQYERDEFDHLKDLSAYLQTTYPALRFNILFIGNSMNPERVLNYDMASKILTVPNVSLDGHFEQTLDKIFIDNEEIMNDFFNQ